MAGFKLGVGLRPSRVDGEHDPGHMWLYWLQSKLDGTQFRGFCPDVDQIPDEFRPQHKWRDFFFDNSVPGIRYVDNYATELARHHDPNCYDKRWSISCDQKTFLDLRCHIPPGRDSVLENSRYSWNTMHEGWNNCASWAIRVVNLEVMKADFLPLPQPARIKHVIEVVAWDTVPDTI